MQNGGYEDYLDARRADQYGFDQVLGAQFDWSKSTIQTLLARLVEKECLTRKKEASSLSIQPFNSDQSRDLLVQDIKDKVCSRRIKNL